MYINAQRLDNRPIAIYYTGEDTRERSPLSSEKKELFESGASVLRDVH